MSKKKIARILLVLAVVASLTLLELTPPQRDLCFFCGGRR